MLSLDNLLHEAECLERGSKGGSISAIGLNQLAKFFNQISPEQPTTLDGRVLLAQQGIDSARTETLLKDIQSEKKKEESLIYVSQHKARQQSVYDAIQNFEILKQNINENQRKRFRDEMLSFFGNKDISRSPVNPNFKLFPTDPQQLGKLSEYAQLFANYQFNPKTEEEEENENETDKKIPFSSVRTIIQQSIAAIASSHLIDESTRQMRIDFFLALLSIICREHLPGDLSQIENSPDDLREMICGSLDFLTSQYRIHNFPNGLETTAEEVDKFAMSHYPNVQPPWPQIWVCIRSGLYGLVETFCRRYRRETSDFWHYFDSYILKEEKMTVEVQLSVFINTKPSNEYEALRSFCYMFVIGEELQQPLADYIKTANDFVFLMLLPHRYSTSNLDIGSGYSSLNDLQQLVSFEASKIFDKGNDRFVYSMLMAIVLKFDLCAKSLIENKLFPIEALHILIVLNKSGLWSQSSAQNLLANIISEFINLLPLKMTTQIVDYLSLVTDRKPLIKFLLSLDISQNSVNLDRTTNGNALKMIQDEIDSNLLSINTLRLYCITHDYDNACKVLIAINTDIPSTFTLNDMSEAVYVGAVLLNKFKEIRSEQAMPIIVNLQNASLNIAVRALSMADKLTQSEKERLLSNVKKLRVECAPHIYSQSEDFPFLYDSSTIEKVTLLSKLLHLLILFDSGRSDIAIAEAVNDKKEPDEFEKQIIPFSEQELDPAVAWISENELPSASLIGAVIIRFLSYYMDYDQKNRYIVSTLFDFCIRIPILSEETNKKILELHENYEKLGLV